MADNEQLEQQLEGDLQGMQDGAEDMDAAAVSCRPCRGLGGAEEVHCADQS